MENEKRNEQEQSPAEILAIFAEAIEARKFVLITQTRENGEIITNPAEPISIDGNYLTIESAGYGFDIEINTVKKVEIMEQPEEEKK